MSQELVCDGNFKRHLFAANSAGGSTRKCRRCGYDVPWNSVKNVAVPIDRAARRLQRIKDNERIRNRRAADRRRREAKKRVAESVR